MRTASPSATRPRWRSWRPRCGSASRPTPRSARTSRRALFHFDPSLRLMSTVDERGGRLWVDSKGAPEAVLPRCTLDRCGRRGPLARATTSRARIQSVVDGYAAEGLRVLAVAERDLDGGRVPEKREEAETDLTLLGLVAMLDPPRPEVAAAVESCHRAGLRVIVITGDHGLTAAAIARRVGIGGDDPRVVQGTEVDRMTDARARRPAARERRADLRPQLAGDEAADRRLPARGGPHRRDDRRRRQRRAGAAPRRHRRGDGPVRHRRGARGLDDGPHRRQLRDDRRGDRGRDGASTTTSASSSSTSSPTPRRR